MKTSPNTKHWSKGQIRAARRVALEPLLRDQGFALRELGNDNVELLDHPGLIVKHNFWCWPERNAHGNPIDLFTLVLGMSFAQAMDIVAQGDF